jgi:hypothetical protein
VIEILEGADCHCAEMLPNGVGLWYSPKTRRTFTVDVTIPTAKQANDTLAQAGHGPVFS